MFSFLFCKCIIFQSKVLSLSQHLKGLIPVNQLLNNLLRQLHYFKVKLHQDYFIDCGTISAISWLILLIIMISDLPAHKSKRNIDSINKSSTVISLPGIGKKIKCSTQNKSNKLSYIETVNNISQNVQYGDKNINYLTKEQSKLKEMLKKMNNDTLHMIDLIRPKQVINKVPREELVLITERQIDNSRKNLSTMQLEIQKLQQKFSKIVEQQLQQVLITKISQVKQDIDFIKNSNIDMRLNIEKDGKEIVRQYSDGYHTKLSILENQKVLLDQKLQRLKNENDRVAEENSRTQTKIQEIDLKIQQNDEEYKDIKNDSLSQTKNKNTETSLRQRKFQIQSMKKRMQIENSQLQYKYYKLLKELQARKKVCDTLSQKEQQVGEKGYKNREQISILQKYNQTLRRIKQEKNRNVLLFLEKERKNKEESSDMEESILPRLNSGESFIPHPRSYQDSILTPRVQRIDHTRKWQSELLEQITTNIAESQHNKRELEKPNLQLQQGKGKEEKLRVEVSQPITKQDIENYSTIQMRPKQVSKPSRQKQIKVTGDQGRQISNYDSHQIIK